MTEAEWLACGDIGELILALNQLSPPTKRKCRLCSVAFCSRLKASLLSETARSALKVAASFADESKKWDKPVTQAISEPVVGLPKTPAVAKDAKKPDAAVPPEPEPGLWYSTVDSGALDPKHEDQWKPLTGGHVFVSGMAEWVTDRAADGTEPGPLTDLFFKNTSLFKLKRKAKDGKTDEESEPATITVLVVVGYSPKPSAKDGCPTGAP